MKMILFVSVIIWALSTTPLLVFLLDKLSKTRAKTLCAVAIFMAYAEGCILAMLALELIE